MRLVQHHGSLYIPSQYHPALYMRPSLPALGDTPISSNTMGELYSPSPSMGSKITGGSVGAAAIGFQTALSTGSKVLGGVAGGLAMAAPFAGPAAPFLLLAAGLIGPVSQLFKGCGTTCTRATEIANEASAALEQVKNAYFAQPVRYRASQVAALYTVEQVNGYINQTCADPTLGTAGQRCISERTVRGGTAPWCPTPDHRGCDYWTAYYDPIANDPDVVPDPIQSGGTQSDVLSGTNQGINAGGFPVPMPLLIGGATLLALVLFTGGDK